MRTVIIRDSDKIKQIIDSCHVCYVGMTEEDGSPYVIPMNFAYKDNTIILHSGPFGKHLDSLRLDNRVCITFCTADRAVRYQHPDVACSYSMTAESVLCKGRITFIEDFYEKYQLMNVIMKKYTNRVFKISDPAINNLKIWTLDPEEITGKLFGQNFKNRNNVMEIE